MKYSLKNKKGIGAVEIIIGAAIISLVLLSVGVAFQNSLKASRAIGKRVQASFLAEEGIEALRMLRDNNWQDISDLSDGGNYYLVWSAGAWATSTQNSFIDETFERKFTVLNTYRDGNDDIAQSGSLDSNTKKVTASVSWREGFSTTTESISAYLTNIFQ
ncbi:MAG: hypothetical protein AAB888_00310 [Patescibacteria group bacterium]